MHAVHGKESHESHTHGMAKNHMNFHSWFLKMKGICAGKDGENRVLPSQMNGRTGTTLKNSFWVKAFLGGTRWLREGTGIYYGC